MVIFTQPQYFRAATPRDLARQAQPYGLEILQTPRVAAAIQQAQSLAGPRIASWLLLLYTVGEVKEYFGARARVRGRLGLGKILLLLLLFIIINTISRGMLCVYFCFRVFMYDRIMIFLAGLWITFAEKITSSTSVSWSTA
jgi:hypothetical protein